MPSAISTDGERSILELPEVVSSMKATMAIDGSDVLIRGRVIVNDRETPEVVRASPAGAGVFDRPRVDDCSAGVDAVTSTAGGEVWLSCLEWRRSQHQFAVLSDSTWRPVAEPTLNQSSCTFDGDPDTGQKGKGAWDPIPGINQTTECLIGGSRDACGIFYFNASEAEEVAASLDGRFSPTERNAIQHAYWFALNRYDTLHWVVGVDDGNLMTFGLDHEADWRDSYLDAARDVANNEIGIAIGNAAFDLGLSRASLQGAVLANLGQLNWIAGGDNIYRSPVSC